MAAACFSYLPQNRFFVAYCNIWDQPTTGELEILDLVVRTKVLGLKKPEFRAFYRTRHKPAVLIEYSEKIVKFNSWDLKKSIKELC